MRRKYRRALVAMHLGVPETWADDGGKDKLIAAIEEVMRVDGAESGPGNATMQAMFVKVWEPGKSTADETVERLRHEYPLKPRPRDIAFRDELDRAARTHEPPAYPDVSLEFLEPDEGPEWEVPIPRVGMHFAPAMEIIHQAVAPTGVDSPEVSAALLSGNCLCGWMVNTNGVAVRLTAHPDCPIHVTG